MVTVLIPTVARGAMLRQALQSIADQTARAKISRVFVSENGGDRASQAICAEFPQLPITWLFRETRLTALEHAQALMKECLQGEFTAILHDDDWWLPHHIGDAVAALEADPAAAVYGADHLLCDNEVLQPDVTFKLLPWFAAGYPTQQTHVWPISHTNVLLGSLSNYMVHYSTMVMRTEALRQSTFVYDLGNPYDNDRMILFALSRVGPLLFNPKASAGVRTHANRDTASFPLEERRRRMCETTRWMVASSVKSWTAVAAVFIQRLAACAEGEIKVQLLRDAAVNEWCLPEMARHLDRGQTPAFFTMFDRAREVFSREQPPLARE